MIHSQHATMHTIYIIHVLSIQIHNKIKMHRKNTKILMLKKCSETTHQTELMNLMISCSCLSYIVKSVLLFSWSIVDNESLIFAYNFCFVELFVHIDYIDIIFEVTIHMQMRIPFLLKILPAFKWKYLSLAADNFRLSLLFTFFQSIQWGAHHSRISWFQSISHSCYFSPPNYETFITGQNCAYFSLLKCCCCFFFFSG